MSDLYELYSPELKKYALIHGHICFGLAVGYRAGKYARGVFKSFPADDHETVVVWLETGGCAQEGIELITSCSCHDIGELMQKKGGKYIFVFYHRTLNRALRLAAKPEIMESYRPIAVLKAKMRRKTASEEEIVQFWEANKLKVKHILESPDEDLFTIEYFDMALLVKLNPFEGVYVPKSRKSGKRLIC